MCPSSNFLVILQYSFRPTQIYTTSFRCEIHRKKSNTSPKLNGQVSLNWSQIVCKPLTCFLSMLFKLLNRSFDLIDQLSPHPPFSAVMTRSFSFLYALMEVSDKHGFSSYTRHVWECSKTKLWTSEDIKLSQVQVMEKALKWRSHSPLFYVVTHSSREKMATRSPSSEVTHSC